MSFNRTESARFAQENQKIVGELHAGADKALAEAASRGFAVAPGDTLATILFAGQAAKDKLVEANGKIYDDRRKVLFEQDEFAMKLIVSLAKLGMQLYAAELMNALTLEDAANTSLRDKGLADVTRMTAEVEGRQVSIIRARAEMERRILVYKDRLVVAEEGALVFERALIDAQLATATEKLKIIESIYLVLAAEELVLAAENRRAATLEVLLAAQLIVADIKKTMIPFYNEKAAARLALADATKAEIPVREAIENLGYARIALENQKAAMEHGIRVAELTVENARRASVTASIAVELARARGRAQVAAASASVRGQIANYRRDAIVSAAEGSADAGIARAEGAAAQEMAQADAEETALSSQLSAVIAGMEARGAAQAAGIRSGAETNLTTETFAEVTRKISGG